MSTIGRTDVLRPLAQLLRLKGTKTAPAEVEIDRPLLPVIDSGRWAENLGILTVYEPFSVTTGGAGVAVFSTRTEADQRAVAVIQNALTNLGLVEGAADWWLLGIEFATTTAGTFGGAQASIGPPRTGGNIVNTTGGISTFDSFIGQTNSVGADPRGAGLDFTRWVAGTTQFPMGQDASRWTTLPQRLQQLNVRSNDNGGGAATIVVIPRYAYTPRGVRPHV